MQNSASNIDVSRKTCIVFCPKEGEGKCPIERMSEIMHLKINESDYKLSIGEVYGSFIDAFQKVIGAEIEIPKSKFVLGHGNIKEMGFLIFNGSTMKSGWWKNSNEIYNVGIFHCCNGSIVLTDESWKGQYREWVSYNEALYLIQGIPEAEVIWMNIFLQMITALKSNLNSEELRLAFIQIYKDTLRLLRIKPLKGGTILVKDTINIALRSITCKQPSNEK